VDVPPHPRVGTWGWAGKAERGGKPGERERFREKVRCERAPESFGLDAVDSGVSGSDEEDVDCSE